MQRRGPGRRSPRGPEPPAGEGDEGMTRARETNRRLPRSCVVAFALVLASTFVGLPALSQMPSDVVHQYRIEVTGPTGAPEPVMVTFPRLSGRRTHPEGHRWPVVVALHGLGEAQRGVARGFLGWNADYHLPHAYEALFRGRLERVDLMGFVRREHLNRLNAWLATGAFEGVAVVAPYTPALLDPASAQDLARYGDWLAGPLLEQVRERYPGLSRAKEGTGIDGVSLGGRIALEVGFRHPDAFGAVGGIQPAVRGDSARLTELVHLDAGQRVRLLTSDGDGFLAATRELSAALGERGVPHDLVVSPGPHDYAFNRGPGAIELLRFGQMALRPEPATE